LAEKHSDGTDSSVYWGMAQAYSTQCDANKLRTVIDRGLAINPDDPALLGAFGSWLSYAGQWDAGAEMIQRALDIEPKFYKRWWLFALAKGHYERGDYDQALAEFDRSYNERNWLSHLQRAYTLPHLGRLEEAVTARESFERLYPGVTIERVLEFYKVYCFSNEFLEKVHWALTEAGLPSRGSINSYDDIQPISAKITEINGTQVEYMDIGEGTPIVFVHGSISDYRAWSYFQNPISEHHRFIAYSTRYAGSQPWLDQGEKFGTQTDADDLIAFIEKLELGPVYVVGWSRGGRVIAPAVNSRPDLFKGAIHYGGCEKCVF